MRRVTVREVIAIAAATLAGPGAGLLAFWLSARLRIPWWFTPSSGWTPAVVDFVPYLRLTLPITATMVLLAGVPIARSYARWPGPRLLALVLTGGAIAGLPCFVLGAAILALPALLSLLHGRSGFTGHHLLLVHIPAFTAWCGAWSALIYGLIAFERPVRPGFA